MGRVISYSYTYSSLTFPYESLVMFTSIIISKRVDCGSITVRHAASVRHQVRARISERRCTGAASAMGGLGGVNRFHARRRLVCGVTGTVTGGRGGGVSTKSLSAGFQHFSTEVENDLAGMTFADSTYELDIGHMTNQIRPESWTEKCHCHLCRYLTCTA